MSLYDFQKQRVYGLVLGLVTNNQDPEKLGRVKVKYHMLEQTVESDWCRVVNFYAGTERGSCWVPEVDDEVVLAFEHGDVNYPFLLGSIYNGKDKPPIPDNPDNNLKRIRTRSGHELTFDDKEGEEKITLLDSSLNNRIEIDVKGDKITIEAAKGHIDLLAKEGTIQILCKEFKLEASESASLISKGPMDVKATKDLTVGTDQAATHTAAKKFSVESTSDAVDIKASTGLKGQGDTVDLKGSSSGSFEGGSKLLLKGGKVDINP